MENDGTTDALSVRDLSLKFGGLTVLDRISLQVRRGEIFSLIGPNGAGKSSIVNCVTGYYRPRSGEVVAFGTDITGMSTRRVAERGITRTYQNIELFRGMTVIENLLLGRHRHMRRGAFLDGIFVGPARREELAQLAVVEDLIDFLELQHVRNTPVGLLPYGLQKRVDLGRALAQQPRLLILDEPMAGMNIEEKEDMARFMLELQAEDEMTILLIEHDMGVVMDISDRVAVLDFGRMIGEGTPDEVRANPEVIRAYIGGGIPAHAAVEKA